MNPRERERERAREREREHARLITKADYATDNRNSQSRIRRSGLFVPQSLPEESQKPSQPEQLVPLVYGVTRSVPNCLKTTRGQGGLKTQQQTKDNVPVCTSFSRLLQEASVDWRCKTTRKLIEPFGASDLLQCARAHTYTFAHASAYTVLHIYTHTYRCSNIYSI